MKKLLSFALFIFGSVTAFAQPTSSSSLDPNAPVMEFTTETIEFGAITQGDIITREFRFTNKGKQPLIITNVLVTCGCTDPQYPKTPVAPGKTGTITVTFKSEGKLGIQDKAITVQSNNRDGDVVLHLKGDVKAASAAEAAPKQAAQVGTDAPKPAATASKPAATSTTVAKPAAKPAPGKAAGKPLVKKAATSAQKPKAAATTTPTTTTAKPKKGNL
ncbi:MAG: DUF1573 domain-containing protein [Bacteroidota bacterium]|jgi:hypothetical protein